MTESSRHPEPSLSRAVMLARRALADAPAGLLTDFDGTLSPIVEEPMAAGLVAGAHEALSALSERLAVVAIVTGRAPLDARRMTGVPKLLIAGNHGIEWLEPGSAEPAPSPAATTVTDLVARALARVPDAEGVVVENKRLSATVHYRNAPDPEAARVAILDSVGDVGPELELRGGRMSLELRPVGLGDKGHAVRTIIDRFGLRGVVVMGDDLTDLDMFRAVADLRASGAIRGVVLGVGGADREVPPEVAAAADVLLADPAEAAAFITELGR